MNKRCTNCGKFPFCDIAYEKNTICDKWIKRQVGMKLDNKNGQEFDFKIIGE